MAVRQLKAGAASPSAVWNRSLRSRGVPPSDRWWDLACAPAELRPESVLTPGQSFAWKRVSADQWLGRLGKSVVLVQQGQTTTWTRVVAGQASLLNIREYFGLEVPAASLRDLYPQWSASCPRLAEVARCLPGVRVLQQDSVETLFAFICSQNNNVSRIALLLDRLCARFGEPICELPDGMVAIDDDGPESSVRELAHVREFNEGRTLYSFPSIGALAAAPEDVLRSLGLGYRAAYVRRCAQALLELGGRQYLDGLKRMSRSDVQAALCELHGIGPKVADCIALFSLGKHDCVPVDVHVWRITTRDYEPSLRTAKSLTPQVYDRVGDAFRSRFGEFAGWAHSLLFGGELAGAMRGRLPEALLADMDSFREGEKVAAAQRRREREKRRENLEAEPVGATVSKRGAKRIRGLEPAAVVATGCPKKRPASRLRIDLD